MRKFLVVLFLFSFALAEAQHSYPQDTFSSPMDIPLILAGTFGELRSNHFHAGLDIKTQQRQGLPVYSIYDGQVKRIKISLSGYGKAIYVAHPNGYTSVYAHLKKFSPEIEAYIKKEQYRRQTYEIELFPNFGELKVDKGEVIAYSGNTGSSSGPHLHFEIRKTASEKPTNPLLYGLEVRDATNPTLSKLFGYPLSEDAQVNQSAKKIELNFTRQKDGSFLANTVKAYGTIGFGFVGFDRQDLAANKNGVYTVKLNVNGETVTAYKFETFSFGETRYINTLIDYDHLARFRQRIQRLFKTPANKLKLYSTLKNNGQIEIEDGLNYTIELLLEDIHGNMTKAIIPVEGKKQEVVITKDIDKTPNYLIAKMPNNFDLGVAKVYFPSGTFYEDFYINLKKGNDTIGVHNNTVTAHKRFTITFDVSQYNEEMRQQMFIARLDKKMKPHHVSTSKRGTTFSTRTRNLGTYTIAMDTIAPKIQPKNFKKNKWLSNYSYLSLRISDDLSGIDTYSAKINGEWILMEYESKKQTLTYNFDDKILDKKQCNLEVVVTDNVGNSTTFTSTFFRN